jgi:glutaredoxin
MIIMYSTHCPKCLILEKKLNEAGVDYKVCEDQQIMEEKGFDFMPVLEVDGQIMGFGEAVKWVNNQ